MPAKNEAQHRAVCAEYGRKKRRGARKGMKKLREFCKSGVRKVSR